MRFMPPHTMMSLGAAVTGTVDASYEAAWLCDGDPAFPIRNASGAAYSIAGTSRRCTAAVIANHNLDEGATIALSSGITASGAAQDVPPNDIRLNVLLTFAAVTVSGCTITFSGNSGPIVVGEVLIGELLDIQSLPPESSMGVLPFEVARDSEYGGLSQDRGAEARTFGGTIYVTDAMKRLLDDWFRACRNNSLPSVIIPIEDEGGSPGIDQDPWVVKWVTYAPRPIVIDLWVVDVAWQELPRFRWP